MVWRIMQPEASLTEHQDTQGRDIRSWRSCTSIDGMSVRGSAEGDGMSAAVAARPTSRLADEARRSPCTMERACLLLRWGGSDGTATVSAHADADACKRVLVTSR